MKAEFEIPVAEDKIVMKVKTIFIAEIEYEDGTGTLHKVIEKFNPYEIIGLLRITASVFEKECALEEQLSLKKGEEK